VSKETKLKGHKAKEVDNIGFKFWYTGAAANENRVEVLIDKSLKNMLHVRLYVCGPAQLLGCRPIRVRVSPESIYVTFLYAIDNEFQFPIWYQLARFCFSNSTFAAPGVPSRGVATIPAGGPPLPPPQLLPFLPHASQDRSKHPLSPWQCCLHGGAQAPPCSPVVSQTHERMGASTAAGSLSVAAFSVDQQPLLNGAGAVGRLTGVAAFSTGQDGPLSRSPPSRLCRPPPPPWRGFPPRVSFPALAYLWARASPTTLSRSSAVSSPATSSSGGQKTLLHASRPPPTAHDVTSRVVFSVPAHRLLASLT
jgi:hypothetical protein